MKRSGVCPSVRLSVCPIMGPQQQTDRMVQRLLGEMRAVARRRRT